MSGSATLTNKQKVSGGVTILDEDKQPFASLADVVAALPDFKLTFTSSDPSVIGVAVRDDGLNVDLSTGKNGNATLTVHVDGFKMPNGDPVPDDVTSVAVVNSKPNALNFLLGAPEEE